VGPSFPFYASDWMASVLEMTLEERGAYITLLAWSWDNGPVPKNEQKIARILSVSGSKSRRVFAAIVDRFLLTPEGYVSERLELVRAEKAAFLDAKSRGGKAGMAKRWGTPADNTVTSVLSENGYQKDNLPSPIPSPSPIPKRSSGADRPQISSSRTPETTLAVVPRGGWNRGVMGNGHMRCDPSTFDACGRGVCIPAFLTSQWRQQIGHGADADETLKAFVRDALASVRSGPIGDDPLVFWRAMWTARHGSQAPRPSHDKGSRTFDAVEQAILEERIAREVARG
jgi:uncharacterized protein YdaU (DUF1376 family)